MVNTGSLLPLEFYLQNTNDVAKGLLGKRLVKQTEEGIVAATIVETEAYLFDDPASHSFRGKTLRNAPMFGLPGRTYVYLSYGVHDMLNIVTGAEGFPEAVLLRAAMPVQGIEIMRGYTSKPDTPTHRLAAGPGLLAKAFNISRKTDINIDVTTKKQGIWIEDAEPVRPHCVVSAARIGLTHAAEEPWRYYILGNAAVSKK